MKAKLLLCTAFVIVAGVGGALVHHYHAYHRFQRASVQPPIALLPPSALRLGATRPVYPYSVIPGGVYSAKEVSNYVAADAVVREHYRDIRAEALRPARTIAPMMAYVSYRKGDRIAWTRKKLPIPQGELVLTDGENLIRARCGNRIRTLPTPLASEVLSGEEEPQSVLFETPLQDTLSTTPTAPAPVMLAENQPLLATGAPSSSSPSFTTTPAVPVLPTGSTGTTTPSGSTSPSERVTPSTPSSPSSPPDTPVPEPSTLVLLISGVGAALFWRNQSSR